jgi:hypothetical protein
MGMLELARLTIRFTIFRWFIKSRMWMGIMLYSSKGGFSSPRSGVPTWLT